MFSNDRQFFKLSDSDSQITCLDTWRNYTYFNLRDFPKYPLIFLRLTLKLWNLLLTTQEKLTSCKYNIKDLEGINSFDCIPESPYASCMN